MELRGTSALIEEQPKNGECERFHSMDSGSRARIRTTEQGVARALSLGPTSRDPVLRRPVVYLEKLLRGETGFPDPAEKNDRWPAGCELFVASTLADIEPGNALLGTTYTRWIEIAERTFASGRYNEDDELAAHVSLTGASTMRDSYLVLSNKYAVGLLGHVQARLTEATEPLLVGWLLSLPGLRYIGIPASRALKSLHGGAVGGWIHTHLILSRFPSWPRLATSQMVELAALCDEEGLWDLGPGSRLQISESWRRRLNRKIDSSVCALLLLKRWIGR